MRSARKRNAAMAESITMNSAMTVPQPMAMVVVLNVNNRDVEIKELTMDRNVMMGIMY